MLPASTATELYQMFVQFGGNPVTFNSTHDASTMYYVYNLTVAHDYENGMYKPIIV